MDDQERLTAALADRYAIEREIDRGGMGTVYLARDPRHDRHVAIKVLDPELGRSLGAERFHREIRTTAGLTHPHILPVHDSGEADGLLYYVMPYVEGESLRARLRAEGRLPVVEAVRVAGEVADALDYAHANGVIHRDVKPGNIMLSSGHAVLGDFGVARAVAEAQEDRITVSGMSPGTPAYMSPEQAAAEPDVDGRSDQYALACVVYEMLAGRPPFTGESSRQVIVQHIGSEPPDIRDARPDVPDAVAAALERALAKEPSDRFDTAAEFAAALSGDAQRPGRTSGRLRRSAAVVAAVAVLAAAGAAIVRSVGTGRDPGPPPGDRPYTVLAAVEGSAPEELRETVEFLLRSALDASHVTRTVPAPAVDRLLRLMDRPDDPLDAGTAREVAQRAGVGTVVQARTDRVGEGLLVGARVETADSGHLVAEARRRVAGEDGVVAAVDEVAADLRRELGESGASLRARAPLPEVLTPSLEALRRYRQGMERAFASRPREAIPLYREALALDPEFAAVHAAMVGAFSTIGERDSALAHAREALERPERLRPEVRRMLDGMLRAMSDFALLDGSSFSTGDHNNVALVLSDLQYFDSAWTVIRKPVRRMVREARRFDPGAELATDRILPIRNAVRIAIARGRMDEAEAFRDSLDVEAGPYWELLRFLDAGEWDRADSVREAVPNFWRTHHNKRAAIAMLDVVRGRVPTVHDLWASLDYGRIGRARARFLLELMYGVPPPDTTVSMENRGLPAVDAFLVHGVREALFGDTARARQVQARLRAARDSATSELFERAADPMLRMLEAGVAARRSAWEEAIRALEPAAERLHEPGYGLSTDRFTVPWVLAELYQSAGRPAEAARHLEALLRARGFDPLHAAVYPAAHFRLGRLHADMDQPDRAARHYAAFLDAFVDPDPEVEWMVEEAREALGRMASDARSAR